MIAAKCPICGKRYQIEALADLPTFPFCSDRCRLVDLGRWIDGAYALPVQEDAPPDSGEDALGDEEE